MNCGPASSPATGGPARPPTAPTLPNWSKLPLAPTGRNWAALTYDEFDKEVVLFGGYNGTSGTIFSDTWVYSSGWRLLTEPTSPTPRYAASMAYDFKDRCVVLYGGLGLKNVLLSDTWKFVKNNWTQLSPTSSPGPLYGAAMTWDVNDSYLVLFGGINSTTVTPPYSTSTWTYVHGAWTLQAAATGPSGRYLAQMAYDTTDGWIVLFGGFGIVTGTSSAALSDTWNYSAGHWTQRHPATSPTATYAGAMANDTPDGYLLLFGGNGPTGSAQVLTWSFANGTWTHQGPATPPPTRAYGSMVFDKRLGKPFLFGGYHLHPSRYLSDTWAYRADSWVRVIPPNPGERQFASMVYDENDRYIVLFGGVGANSFYDNKTWTFAGGDWSMLRTPVAPSPRIGQAMTYDAGDGYVVLFGGANSTGVFDSDTWSFSAGAWTQLQPNQPQNSFSNSAPEARTAAGMVYDEVDGEVVLFGGYSNTSNYGRIGFDMINDTWTFTGGLWSRITAYCYPNCGVAPPRMELPAMGYDASDGYVVLFGGENFTGVTYRSTWTFSGGAWTNISATAGSPPSARAGATFTYDGFDGYLLLFGGARTPAVLSNQTWSFAGGTWTQLNPAVNPGALRQSTMAYDARDGYVVLLSEDYNPPLGNPQLDGTWVY